MHEATLARDILERTIKLNTQGEPISSISIRVGEFRNVDRESLAFAFSAMRSFYAATADAELLIEEVPLQVLCKNNGHKYRPISNMYFACPECSGPIGEIISGQELDIVELKTKQPLPETPGTVS